MIEEGCKRTRRYSAPRSTQVGRREKLIARHERRGLIYQLFYHQNQQTQRWQFHSASLILGVSCFSKNVFHGADLFPKRSLRSGCHLRESEECYHRVIVRRLDGRVRRNLIKIADALAVE